jgi:hypothetical protein
MWRTLGSYWHMKCGPKTGTLELLRFISHWALGATRNVDDPQQLATGKHTKSFGKWTIEIGDLH